MSTHINSLTITEEAKMECLKNDSVLEIDQIILNDGALLQGILDDPKCGI